KYIDLLPKGVNKGSTLIKLIDFLKVPKDKVLVAGDTLNDLSLFEIGVQGVAVGKSEKGLIEATSENKLTFQATKAGAGGILECMESIRPFANFIPKKT